MFLLFDTYVVYESGPIMTITSSILNDLYKRLTPADQTEFVTTIIRKYLTDLDKLKNLKILEKYSVQKILEFFYEFNIPNATLFQILDQNRSIFVVTISLSLILNNFRKFGLGSLEYFEKG